MHQLAANFTTACKGEFITVQFVSNILSMCKVVAN